MLTRSVSHTGCCKEPDKQLGGNQLQQGPGGQGGGQQLPWEGGECGLLSQSHREFIGVQIRDKVVRGVMNFLHVMLPDEPEERA